jgi:hypothetical protein
LSNQPSNGNALDEWKEARSIIARFDNSLSDLRKYGFSFVTALLAANGLISQGGTSVVTVQVKAAILVATMGLIVALKLLDTHYRHFQEAASMRGRILEGRLNLDLTNDISFFYAMNRFWWYVQVLYYGFVGLTALLGIAILWSNIPLLIMILVAAFVSGGLIYIINKPEKSWAVGDWSVDNKIVSQGTPVRITYTNLNSEDRKPVTFKLWWNFKKESEITKGDYEPANEVEVKLKYFDNYDWLWETETVVPGLYELAMSSDGVQSNGGTEMPLEKMTIQITPAVKKDGPVKNLLDKNSP